MFSRMVTKKSQISTDQDLTELSWLTRADIFEKSSNPNKTRQMTDELNPSNSRSISKIDQDKLIDRRSSSTSLFDSSDSEHDVDSSSLNSSTERLGQSSSDVVSPPHSALCFWILFSIEDSMNKALTLNEICDWIEENIERRNDQKNLLLDEQFIQSSRLKSKVRYHMTKQISFFVKISHDPVSDVKFRYPLWTVDRNKRNLLLDTLLTMTTGQLSLFTNQTIEIYERLCDERRRSILQRINDENSCPNGLISMSSKREKIIHRLTSNDEATITTNILTNNKRKKQQSNIESNKINEYSLEVVDAALTLLLLRQPR